MVNSSERYHGLDLCRAVMVLLGLVLHVAMIYSPKQEWRLTSEMTASYMELILFFIKAFRMESFYFVSGFFFVLTLLKNKPQFLKGRCLRIALPLLFCGFTLNYVMDVHSYNREFSDGFMYYLEGEWLGHLWFLGNLLVYFLVSIPFCRLLLKVGKINENLLLILFCFFVPGVAVVAKEFSELTFKDTFLIVHFGKVWYYYPYFLLGAFCYAQKESFLKLLRWKYLVVVFALYIAFMYAYSLNLAGVKKFLYLYSRGMLVFCMVSGFCIVGAAGSVIARKVSDASYTIYLLHMPLIVVFYYYVFLPLNWDPLLEFLILLGAVIPVTYWFHVKVVKNIPLLEFLLNGVYGKPKSSQSVKKAGASL